MGATNRPGFGPLSGASNARMLFSPTAPVNPRTKDIWVHTTTGNQKYWTGSAWQSVGVTEGIYTEDTQVITFKQDINGVPTIKMAVGIINDKDNIPTPLIVFGAGDGQGNNRGYIAKGTDSLNMFYVGNLGAGEVAGLAIYKDKIETTVPSITFNKSLANEFILNATNWNNKLYEADMKTILQTPAKALGIVKENISSINADVIVGNTLSTYGFNQVANNYITMNKQMIYFKEVASPTHLNKMAIGYLPDHTGTNVPCFILGAGAGNDSSVSKGYISKDANGLNMFYIGTNNQAQGITIKSDGIYCTSALKLDVTLADTYIASASAWANKMQKLNSSGNFGVGLSGKRIELSDTLISKNSSNQNQGLYIDSTYSDMYLYYGGVEMFKIYNDIGTAVQFRIYNNEMMGYNTNQNKLYPKGTWDFGSVTITGVNKLICVSATAPSNPATNDVWLDIS